MSNHEDLKRVADRMLAGAARIYHDELNANDFDFLRSGRSAFREAQLPPEEREQLPIDPYLGIEVHREGIAPHINPAGKGNLFVPIKAGDVLLWNKRGRSRPIVGVIGSAGARVKVWDAARDRVTYIEEKNLRFTFEDLAKFNAAAETAGPSPQLGRAILDESNERRLDQTLKDRRRDLHG